MMRVLLFFSVLSFFYQGSSLFAQDEPVPGTTPRIILNPLGHSAKIRKLLFTPDGQQLVSVAQDKSIHLWDIQTQQIVSTFRSAIGNAEEGMFYAADLSPDGKTLLAGGHPTDFDKNTGYFLVIDIASGEQSGVGSGHLDIINALKFSPADPRIIASGSEDGTVKVWELTNGKPSEKATLSIGSSVSDLSFSTKGLKLAVATETDKVLLYDLSGVGSIKIKDSPQKTLKKHDGLVNAVAFSPDGEYLATGGEDRMIHLYKSDGSYLQELDMFDHPVTSLSFSHDGKILIATGENEGTAVSYAIPGGGKNATFQEHDNTVFASAFSPQSVDGNYRVATAGGGDNLILVWNALTGRTVAKMTGKGKTIWNLSFGQDMKLLISNSLGEQSEDAFYEVMFNFENFSLASVEEQQIKISSEKKQISNEYKLTVPGGKNIDNDPKADGRILSYAFTKDGNTIVGSDFSLKMYNKDGTLLKDFVGHKGEVNSLTISGDGRFLASGSIDQTIKLWYLEEAGEMVSVWNYFDDPDWHQYFQKAGLTDAAKANSVESWKAVIAHFEQVGDKANLRFISDEFALQGEIVQPFVSLFLTNDFNWVCWTPEGYFHRSNEGDQYFGFQRDKGIVELAEFFAAGQYNDILFKPGEMRESLKQGKRVADILRANGERIFNLATQYLPSAVLFDLPTHGGEGQTRGGGAGSMLQEEKMDYYYTDSLDIFLTVQAFDGGGGVKELRIYQNDKLVVQDRDLPPTYKQGDSFEKAYRVELLPLSENKFEAVVINSLGTESNRNSGNRLTVEYRGKIVPTSDLYVFSLGINEYENQEYKLRYAKPDAQTFMSKITQGARRLYRNVHKYEIYDKEGLRDKVMDAFAEIASKAKPNDVFIFYYAGHGAINSIDPTNEVDKEFFLIMHDVTQMYGSGEAMEKAIGSRELISKFSQIKAQKQLVLLDACQSAGAVDAFAARGSVEEKAILQLSRSAGSAILAASGTKQFASEYDVLGHGVFTYALLEALAGKADNGDQQITITELKGYLDSRVPELTEEFRGSRQYPNGQLIGQDFPVSLIVK